MQNYSFLEKKLHDLILGNKFINKSLFEIEKILFLKKNNNNINDKHVFITSLPRSGTTVLLYYIYSSNEFYSLTYRNMPFIMAPNLSKIYKKKGFLEKKNRFHNDGIKFDLDSPESFDEIFFKTFDNQKNIKNNLFSDYVSLITKNGKRRYLSKNNNNYKRIDFLTSAFPNSFILIPVRSPIDHSHSLHEQHLNFYNLQNKDNFILRYMNYLGHNEFGIDHISWSTPLEYNNFNEVNYWLEQWFLFYENIYTKYKNNKNCIFFTYENLSQVEFRKKLNERIDIQNPKVMDFKTKEKKVDNNIFNQKLLTKCIDLYKIFFSA